MKVSRVKEEKREGENKRERERGRNNECSPQKYALRVMNSVFIKAFSSIF